jgi:hypothetical protein
MVMSSGDLDSLRSAIAVNLEYSAPLEIREQIVCCSRGVDYM